MNSPGSLIYQERGNLIQLNVISENLYFSGLLQGFVLSNDIKEHANSIKTHYAHLAEAWHRITGQKLAKMSEILNFFAHQAQQALEPQTAHLLNITGPLQQMKGIVDGFNMRYASRIEKKTISPLTLADLFFINSQPELLDVGAYVKQSVLHFEGSATSDYGKRTGKFLSLQSALLVSNRAATTLLSFPRTTDATTYPNFASSWVNLLWYPKFLKRTFFRIKIAGAESYGFQYVGFPGQIVSTDSFSASVITGPKLTTTVMRQVDFTDRNFESRPTPVLSAWMSLAASFYTRNVTYSDFVGNWNRSRSNLISKDWKTVSVYNSQVLVLESSESGLNTYDRTASYLENHATLEETTTTHSTGEQLKKSRMSLIELTTNPEFGSHSKLDVTDHGAIMKAFSPKHGDYVDIFRLPLKNSFNDAHMDSRERLGLPMESDYEYLPLNSLNS